MEARINAVMANRKVNYWTTRRAIEESIPNIGSNDEFPPLRTKTLENNTPGYAEHSSQQPAQSGPRASDPKP